MGMQMNITGVEQVRAALARVGKEAPHLLGRALYREGERIMLASKRIVPVETGALRASGMVRSPEQDAAGRVSVTLAYGGAAAPYALYVHEKLGAHHKPPTQAKYLEQPLREAEPGMATRLAADIKDGFERAAGGR